MIEQWMKEKKPISFIIEQLDITRRVFRKRYPDYKGAQGSNAMLKGPELQRSNFDLIESTGSCASHTTVETQKLWLKRYLIDRDGNHCSQCGWSEVNPQTGNTPIELHHIDGNPAHNHLSNVCILCPNCHSLTSTFRRIKRDQVLGSIPSCATIEEL